MSYFRSRLIGNLLLTFGLIAIALILREMISISLRHDSFFTGWLLLGCMTVLALFNLRKKIPYLNLLRANTWLQFHIYLGLFSIAVFSMHIHFRIPNGFLEGLLASLYVMVAGSGLAGLWLSRRLAPRLSRRGEQVLYERIPALRVRLRDEVETLVLKAVSEFGSTTLADLYKEILFPFFSGPRNFWFHIFESNHPYHQLREKMRLTHRYLNTKEKEILSEIAHRVRVKDDLDYQHAGQTLLKRWLFVHIPLTWGLLMFSLAHLLLVYTFIGDI